MASKGSYRKSGSRSPFVKAELRNEEGGGMWIPPKRRYLYKLSLGIVSTRFSFEKGKFYVYPV